MLIKKWIDPLNHDSFPSTTKFTPPTVTNGSKMAVSQQRWISCQEVLQVAPHEQRGGLDAGGAQRGLPLQERHLGTHPVTRGEETGFKLPFLDIAFINKVPQTVWFLVVVGILLIWFSNISMVWKLQHGNLSINGLSIKLSKFPPLPEITLIMTWHDVSW